MTGITMPPDLGHDQEDDQCAALSEDAHRSWRAFSEARTRQGKAKRTPNDVAQLLGIKPSILRHHIAEIVDAGLAKFDQGHVVELAEPCPHRALSHATGMPGHAPARSTQAINQASDAGNHPPSEGSFLPPASGDGRTKPQALAVKEYNPAKTARGLVDYFRMQCARHFFGMTPGTVNADALRVQISRWMRQDGISYETVKAMIDVFVSDRNFIRATTPAWKSFLAQRQKLFLMVEDKQNRQSTTDYWSRKVKDAYKAR